MPKGFIEAQNGVQLEIVDAAARADVSAAKSQIAKLTTPSGTLEISENGTFDVTRFAQAVVNVTGGGSGTDTDADTSNMWCGLYSASNDLFSNENGWSLDIPHGLGAVPDWAIVIRTTYTNNTSFVGGWVGNLGANFVFMNGRDFSGKREDVSLQDDAANYLHASSNVLTCKTPGWGGTLGADIVLLVAVGLNGGDADA